MIGKELIYRLNQVLNEAVPTGTWVDRKTSFDFLYEAAKDFVKETKTLHSTQTITTSSGQTAYSLNPDFLEVYSTKGFRDEDKVLKYSDGTNTYWVPWQPYTTTFYNNNTTSVLIPNRFSIIDATPESRITGTCTASSAQSGGESTLNASAATFSADAGDTVVNTTTGDLGIVLSQTSTTALLTAMFDIDGRASTNASWTNADGYFIQAGARFQIVLDPPPSTSGHTITIPYLQRPAPVYSDYGAYSFAVGYEEAIIYYAAWKYKYRDTSRPNKEDQLFKIYDNMVRKAKGNFNMMTGRQTIQVSWKK